MDKSKIYTAEMAARAMADQILRGNRYAERFHIEVPEGIQEVPVANARKPATRKMMPGRSI